MKNKNLTVIIRGSYTNVSYPIKPKQSTTDRDEIAYQMTAEKLNGKAYLFTVNFSDKKFQADVTFTGITEITASVSLFNVGFSRMGEINEIFGEAIKFVERECESMADFLEKLYLYNKVKPPTTNKAMEQIEKLFNEIELLKKTKSDKRRSSKGATNE